MAYLENLPAKGYKTFALAELPAASPFVRKDTYHLETPYYAIALDENGHMVSIFDKEQDRELVQPGKAANQLRLYEDKPIYFDNWDIDMYYVEKSWPVDELVSLRWSETARCVPPWSWSTAATRAPSGARPLLCQFPPD